MQVVVNSLMTRYERDGEGRVVVVLHGWGDSSQGLRALMHELAKSYTVVALDLPGFGGTDAPKSAWGLDEYASFVQAFLGKIGVTHVYAFIAHSNGGAITMRGLGAGTLTADKLVLLASSGIRNVYKGRNKALRLIAKTGKVLTLVLPSSVRQKLRRKVYKTIGSDMLVAEHLQETFKKVVTQDVQPDAAKLTLPVLLLYGEQDTATPIQFGRQFHELMANSTLEIVADAGHFIHLDQPHKVQAAIKEFLA